MDNVKMALKKSWKLGAIIGALTYVIAWLITFFKIPTLNIAFGDYSITASAVNINVRNQILSKGIEPEFGTKILDFVRGYIPWTIGSIIGLYIGTVAIAFIGILAIQYLPEFKFLGKDSRVNKTAALLFYGSLIGAFVMGTISGIGFVPVALALLIYYILIAFILGLAIRNKTLAKIIGVF